MRKSKFVRGLYTIFIGFTLLWTLFPLLATDNAGSGPRVFYFEIHQDIMPSAWRTVQSALREADEADADYILLSLDTYGGLLDAADSIRTRLLSSNIPVIVHVTNNAASAGALIAMSCDSIYMSSYAKIGAASVVDQSGNVMPDKYQSYMRGMMRATAEANGRDPDMAESMVGAIKTIPGIIDSGKVLTFTTSEAIENGFCEGKAETWQDALQLAGIEDYTLLRYEPSAMDKTMGLLLSPVLRGLCITFIFLGIYFELQTPGIGFPLAIAILAALLYFAPLFVEGLAANWEILLFVVGIVLLALEIFVIPGFGVAGVSGIGLIFTALVLSMVQNDGFNFDFSGTGSLVEAFGIVMGAIAAAVIVIVAFFGRFLSSPLFKKVALLTSENAVEGYNTNMPELSELKGVEGVAVSDLRPAGKVEINGDWYDAQTEAEYVLKGEQVIVLEVKNSYLVVRKR
ncbi:MAG: NfeD family protein [Chitinophagales bacterium]|nr:nodulation protein NfeD [Chitinophagales bacterium]HQU76837.1 NfeD family protein [Chitinophagales bacterium]HRX23037.1 NfeD family protein [Chitinophagales bacterium]